MRKFIELTAIAAPLLRINVDTDAIIPSREIKGVSKQGLGEGLFAGWRYTKPGGREENPDFVLNQEPYRNAEILLSGTNFGCGSSREHAVWALSEWGIRCVVAPSFGAIFYGNCVRNGVLPIVLPEAAVTALAKAIEPSPSENRITASLTECTVTGPEGDTHQFKISSGDREMLLEGLDAIAATMRRDDEILSFRARDRLRRPWVYL